MIAGLPGTGVGGFFYLLASGWMLVRESWSRLTAGNNTSRTSLVKKQVVLVLFIVVGMWATGELTGRMLVIAAHGGRIGHALGLRTQTIWKRSLFYWTVATLVSLYVLMQGLRIGVKLSGYERSHPLRTIGTTPMVEEASVALQPVLIARRPGE